MKIILVFVMIFVLGFLAAGVNAESLSVETDLSKAFDRAKAENKMLFIQFGREACGNCQNLKTLVKGNKLDLNSKEFIYADLNCDDSKTEQLFYSKFRGSGSTLPFVVIADSSGKQLSFRTGYGNAEEYNKFIKEAKAKIK
jgi:thioredoxin-related protein